MEPYLIQCESCGTIIEVELDKFYFADKQFVIRRCPKSKLTRSFKFFDKGGKGKRDEWKKHGYRIYGKRKGEG